MLTTLVNPSLFTAARSFALLSDDRGDSLCYNLFRRNFLLHEKNPRFKRGFSLLFRRIVEYFVYCRAKLYYRFLHRNTAKLCARGVEVTAAAKLFCHALNVYFAIRARGNAYNFIYRAESKRRLNAFHGKQSVRRLRRVDARKVLV